MAFYAISIIVLTLMVATECINQAWFADDGTGVGKIRQLKEWWDKLSEWGPAFGYFPKPTKCWLIVKDEQAKETAETIFEGVPINITIEGERHLGAVIGTSAFKSKFVNEKVATWISEIDALTPGC